MIPEGHPGIGEHVFGIGLLFEFEHGIAKTIGRFIPAGENSFVQSYQGLRHVSSYQRHVTRRLAGASDDGCCTAIFAVAAGSGLSDRVVGKLGRLCGREVRFLGPDTGFSHPEALRITG